MASTTTLPTAIPPLPSPLTTLGPLRAPQPSTFAVWEPPIRRLPHPAHQLTPSRRHCHHPNRLHAGRHPTLHTPRRCLPRRPDHPIPRIPNRLLDRQRRRAFCHLGNIGEPIKCANTSRWTTSQYPRRRPQPRYILVRRLCPPALNLLFAKKLKDYNR